jgi:hypothetical protein
LTPGWAETTAATASSRSGRHGHGGQQRRAAGVAAANTPPMRLRRRRAAAAAYAASTSRTDMPSVRRSRKGLAHQREAVLPWVEQVAQGDEGVHVPSEPHARSAGW